MLGPSWPPCGRPGSRGCWSRRSRRGCRPPGSWRGGPPPGTRRSHTPRQQLAEVPVAGVADERDVAQPGKQEMHVHAAPNGPRQCFDGAPHGCEVRVGNPDEVASRADDRRQHRGRFHVAAAGGRDARRVGAWGAAKAEGSWPAALHTGPGRAHQPLVWRGIKVRSIGRRVEIAAEAGILRHTSVRQAKATRRECRFVSSSPIFLRVTSAAAGDTRTPQATPSPTRGSQLSGRACGRSVRRGRRRRSSRRAADAARGRRARREP